MLYLAESTLQPGAGYIVLNSAYAAEVAFDIVPAAGEASSLLSGTNVALEVAAGKAADYRAFTFTGLRLALSCRFLLRQRVIDQ